MIFKFDEFLNEENKWSEEKLQKLADKYDTRRELQISKDIEDRGAYQAIVKKKLLKKNI